MDRNAKSKLPKKLAFLSVPLAATSPVFADLPATATETSEIQKSSDTPAPSASAPTTEVTAAIPVVSQTTRPSTYRVKSGDTVTQIAKRFGLSITSIAKLNNLGPKSLIRVGQVIKLVGNTPPEVEAESYRVRPGDTLSGIASRHQLTLSELTSINRISSSTLIYPGQVLRVAKVIPSSQPPVGAPDTYVVATGDSLDSVAEKFGITLGALREYNDLARASIIYVGQVLNLKPPVGQVKAPKPPKPASSASTLSDEISSLDPMRPTGACSIHGFHTVLSGETISRIAAVYGVSTQSVLSANSLSWSSTIYVGQRLTIPGVHEIKNCPSITKMSQEMKQNAQVIYRVGKDLGVSDYGIVIALAAAMQESSLVNIDYGDRDSVGLFQQRTSQGWGTIAQIMDPKYSARAFFGGPTGPNAEKIRGLLDIKNWSTMSLAKAAQAVQISAFPDAYQKWELSAWSWFDQIESEINDG
ncbi:MAG: LysM peptidoglycan-binding domain-containing protein [Micrococcales bacterium]|nr:LysM peptidoglycan-binding domain-containing protein [Micrococcales bacterium]